jgi:hypothetical protein
MRAMREAQGNRAKRVMKNSAIYAFSRVLERALSFLIGILVAIHLGSTGLGVYSAAWAFYGLIVVASAAGTIDYLVREVSRDRTRTSTYTVHLSVMAFVAATVLLVAGEVTVRFLGFSPGLEAGCRSCSWRSSPRCSTGSRRRCSSHTAESCTRRSRGSAAPSSMSGCRRGSSPVTTGSPPCSGVRGIEYVVAIVYFFIINLKISRLKPQFSWSLARHIIHDIRAFAASSIVAALFTRPEIVILSLIVTEDQVGIYSAATRLVELPLTLTEAFMVNVFPQLAESFRSAEDRFLKWQSAAVRVILAFTLLFAAGCLAAADEIVRIVYGDDFGEAATVLRIIATNIAFFGLIAVFWRSLVARGGTRHESEAPDVHRRGPNRLGGGAHRSVRRHRRGHLGHGELGAAPRPPRAGHGTQRRAARPAPPELALRSRGGRRGRSDVGPRTVDSGGVGRPGRGPPLPADARRVPRGQRGGSPSAVGPSSPALGRRTREGDGRRLMQCSNLALSVAGGPATGSMRDSGGCRP